MPTKLEAIARRFWSKTYFGRRCWEWKGSRDQVTGFGTFRMDGQLLDAHRVAWLVTHGPPAAGLSVEHTCGNLSCVRPEHLQLRSETAPKNLR